MGRNVNEILGASTSAPEENNNPATAAPATAAPTTAAPTTGAPAKGDVNAGKLPVFVPKLPNSKTQPPLTGQINGKAFSIPRGVVSYVSPDVYEVVTNSLKNSDEAEEYYNTVNALLQARAEQEGKMI